MAEKNSTSHQRRLVDGKYSRWLTLLLASCSPAELASSSGSNCESK